MNENWNVKYMNENWNVRNGLWIFIQTGQKEYKVSNSIMEHRAVKMS